MLTVNSMSQGGWGEQSSPTAFFYDAQSLRCRSYLYWFRHK